MPTLITKQITERMLNTVRVTEKFVSRPADYIFAQLIATYAPDVQLELYWPEQFPNPVMNLWFPGVPLGMALADVCKYCGVELSVTDRGTIKLAPKAHREEAMKHRVVIEPDNRTWQKVPPRIQD